MARRTTRTSIVKFLSIHGVRWPSLRPNASSLVSLGSVLATDESRGGGSAPATTGRCESLKFSGPLLIGRGTRSREEVLRFSCETPRRAFFSAKRNQNIFPTESCWGPDSGPIQSSRSATTSRAQCLEARIVLLGLLVRKMWRR